MSETIHHQIVIVGGGTAGITVAAQLTRGWFQRRDVAVIEPSDKHYYQPLWTLVGAGLARKEATERMEASVIPRGVTSGFGMPWMSSFPSRICSGLGTAGQSFMTGWFLERVYRSTGRRFRG